MSPWKRGAAVLAVGASLLAMPISFDFTRSDYATSWTVDGVVKFTTACAHPTHCIDGYMDYCGVSFDGPPLSGYNIHDGEDNY